MAQLSSDELHHFNTAFSSELVDAHADQVALAPMKAPMHADFAGVDPKTVFCQNWDKVATVLQTIADLVPNIIVRGALKVVVAAGNSLKSAICH